MNNILINNSRQPVINIYDMVSDCLEFLASKVTRLFKNLFSITPLNASNDMRQRVVVPNNTKSPQFLSVESAISVKEASLLLPNVPDSALEIANDPVVSTIEDSPLNEHWNRDMFFDAFDCAPKRKGEQKDAALQEIVKRYGENPLDCFPNEFFEALFDNFSNKNLKNDMLELIVTSRLENREDPGRTLPWIRKVSDEKLKDKMLELVVKRYEELSSSLYKSKIAKILRETSGGN